jgi:hypothetical protein
MPLKIEGADLLVGAVDCHVHACPHINGRTVTVPDAIRQAAAAGMAGIGLMDNFSNSSGYAAMAMSELANLGIDCWGGLIMEPCAGGVSAHVAEVAVDYGYGPGTGARFVSFPTHHTRAIAVLERRSPAYIENCFHVPLGGEIQDETKRILDIIAARDVVLNTGHISGPEAVRLCEEAVRRGVGRMLVPSGYYAPDEIRAIVATGAFAEFSFYVLTHACNVPVTNIDEEKHAPPLVLLSDLLERMRAAGPAHSVMSGDMGIHLLPPPVEGLRQFLVSVRSGGGFTAEELRRMVVENPTRLFRVGSGLAAYR